MIEAITDRARSSIRYLSRPYQIFSALRIGVPRGTGAPPENKDKPLTDEQIRQIIREEGGGNSHEAIRQLSRERAKAARRARDAEEKLKKLETGGRIAPEGAVIIQGDEAKAWPELSKFLGESKITIPKLLETAKAAPGLAAKVAEQEASSQRAEAAKSLGWNAGALGEVIEAKGLAIELRDVLVEVDGKKVKQPTWCTRKASEDKAEWTPLGDYADEHLKLFIPSLTAEGDESGETPTTESRGRQGTAGTQWPDQSRSRAPSAKGPTKTDQELRQDAVATGAYGAL